MKKDELRQIVLEVVEELKSSKSKTTNENKIETIKNLIREVIQEDRQSELRTKYVGTEPGKIKPYQFDQFFEEAKKNPLALKYADNLLFLLNKSSRDEKERFFKDKDYELFLKKHGLIDSYYKLLPVIKLKNPDYIELRNFKNISEFKKFISTLKPADESGESKPALSLLNREKLNATGIKFLGTVDGYDCFEINKNNLKDKSKAYSAYREYLCRGGTSFCTAANQSTFNQYVDEGPLFLFVNESDKDAPYQFHYESQQFMDASDNSVI